MQKHTLQTAVFESSAPATQLGGFWLGCFKYSKYTEIVTYEIGIFSSHPKTAEEISHAPPAAVVDGLGDV